MSGDVDVDVDFFLRWDAGDKIQDARCEIRDTDIDIDVD